MLRAVGDRSNDVVTELTDGRPGPRCARPPLMMKSGADRAHCFSQDRSSSIQITKSARPARTLNTREGVTAADGPSCIDAEHDSAEGLCRPYRS
jgi:hypothetical protein